MSNKQVYFKNTVYYISMPVFRNLLAFITLPIMTRYLAPADYGVLAMMSMLVNFGPILFLGVNASVVRFYFKYKDDYQQLSSMLSSNVIFMIVMLLFYGLIMLCSYPFINNYFFSGKVPVLFLMLFYAQFVIMQVNAVNQSFAQNQHQGRQWAISEFVYAIIQVPLAIILVIARLFTYESIIISSLVAEAVKFTVIYYFYGKYYRPHLNFEKLKESIAYAWPILPTSIMGYAYQYFDRLLLSKYYGLLQVGILDMSNRFGQIVKMMLDGVDGALSPLNMECITENTKRSLERMAKINLLVMYLMLLGSLAIIFLIREVVVLLTTEKFHFVIYVAPIYIYYQMFAILSLPAYWLIFHHVDKTYFKIIINAIFLVSSILINLLLIPRFGVIGAAIAACISSAIVQTAKFIIGLKLTPIPIKKRKVSAMFVVAIIMTMAAYALYYYHIPVILDVASKSVMFLVFAGMGYSLGIYTTLDIKEYGKIFVGSVKMRIFAEKGDGV